MCTRDCSSCSERVEREDTNVRFLVQRKDVGDGPSCSDRVVAGESSNERAEPNVCHRRGSVGVGAADPTALDWV